MRTDHIEEQYIPAGDIGAWHEALRDVPHAFAHTAECCLALQASTNWPTFLYSLRTADGHVVCPVSERSFDGYLHFVTPYQFSGFTAIGSISGFVERWRVFAAARAAVTGYFALHPAVASAGCYDASEATTNNSLYLVDLRPSVDALMARFDRSRRRQLRRNDADLKRIVLDRERLTDFLVRTYPDFIKRVGAGKSHAFTSATLRALTNAPQTEVAGIEIDGRVTAVYVWGYTGANGDCLLNVATTAGREFTTLLLWHGMLTLKQHGVEWLNLGGGIVEDDAVARSKQRFHPMRRPLVAVKQIYRPDIYQRLCDAAHVSPSPSGYFPPYMPR